MNSDKLPIIPVIYLIVADCETVFDKNFTEISLEKQQNPTIHSRSFIIQFLMWDVIYNVKG